MSKAGDFVINVERPYPVWCELCYGGEVLKRFSHRELSDLLYATEKAMQEARLMLPEKDRIEV